MSVEAMQSIEMDEENSASQTVCPCYSFFSWSGCCVVSQAVEAS